MSQDPQPISPQNRGGIWLAIVIASIAVGVIWSGIFSGSTGIFGDSGVVTFQDVIHESIREICRLLIFTTLLCLGFQVYSWKDHRHLGKLSLMFMRCLAIIAAIESVRIAQIPHGMMRIILLSIVQYVLFAIGVFSLFAMHFKQAVAFTTVCTVGVLLIWLGTQISTWMI